MPRARARALLGGAHALAAERLAEYLGVRFLGEQETQAAELSPIFGDGRAGQAAAVVG
jgi:hypothetical protein